MPNPKIETDLAEILGEIKSDQKLALKSIEDLKIGQAKLEGKIETLDGKIEQLDKRLGSVEFANRGIFVGIILLVFGGAIKVLGLIP